MMNLLLVISMTFVLAIIFQETAPASECPDNLSCVKIPPNEPIKIGVIGDMSGQTISFGIDQVRAIELALANRGGRILGHPVKLEIRDSQCSQEGGKVVAEELVSDSQIVALFGTACSQSAGIASKIMSEAGLVMISGSNSASSLTSIDGKQGALWQPGYFRTSPNIHQGAQQAASFSSVKLDD